ncbi:MAG: amino acid permease [Bryobacteraceae bacterium]|nr:amino acid permease [Bryobacteraceae bacterium]
MASGPSLLRVIGPAGLTAIAVNGVIGAGIFVLPATVAGILGEASPLAYVVAGAAAVLIALSFAEAGSYFDRAGGPYLYAREAFGPFVGFEVGWMFLLGRLAGAAAIANAFAAYLGYADPALSLPGARSIAITASITVLAAMNYAGVRYGSLVVNLLTGAKLIPLLIFVAVGLFSIDVRSVLPAAPPPLAPLREASLVLLFALGGFEFASVPSEEVIGSRRYLPYATVIAIALSVTLCLLIQIVCVGALPNLAASATPIASAAQQFLGPAGAALMAAAAVFSTTGTNSTILLIGPRLLYALAAGGQLPEPLARIHPRFRTPHVAVVVFAAATLALALSGTFVTLAALNAIARLLYSLTTCAAVPILRRRTLPEVRTFTLPFGSLFPILGILASAFLLTGMNQSQLAVGLAGLLTGAALYLLRRGSPPVKVDPELRSPN